MFFCPSTKLGIGKELKAHYNEKVKN